MALESEGTVTDETQLRAALTALTNCVRPITRAREF